MSRTEARAPPLRMMKGGPSMEALHGAAVDYPAGQSSDAVTVRMVNDNVRLYL